MIAYDTGRKRRSEDEMDDRVGRRWKKLKSKVNPCPFCHSCRQWLARSLMNRIKRYHVECDVCYWCGKSMPTIRMAIRAWNRDKGTLGIKPCIDKRLLDIAKGHIGGEDNEKKTD